MWVGMVPACSRDVSFDVLLVLLTLVVLFFCMFRTAVILGLNASLDYAGILIQKK